MIDDGSFERDVQIFVFSLLIGLVIGGFVVYLMLGHPTPAPAPAPTSAQCEAGQASLIKQREEAVAKLNKCNALLATHSPVSPPTEKPDVPTVSPVPTETETPPSVSPGGVPIPKRPPSRPAGEVPAVEVVGATRITTPSAAVIKMGQEQELSPGYKVRLVAISRRKTGTFCVVAGEGFGSSGARIANGGSVKTTWNGQKLTVGAATQGAQACRISVKP